MLQISVLNRILFMLLVVMQWHWGHSADTQLPVQNHATTTMPTTDYILNGKLVDKSIFDSFLKPLKQTKNSWFCMDMNFTGKDGKELGGGLTGFDVRDDQGNIYKCSVRSSSEGSVHTITKKTK